MENGNSIEKPSPKDQAISEQNSPCPSISTAMIDSDTTTNGNVRLTNPEEVAQEWLEKFNLNTLSSANFYHHWRTKVPVVFGPHQIHNSLDIAYDDNQANVMLFEPLKRFLSGNSDPEGFLQELTTFKESFSSTLCGRLFKSGETTYSCRDCGLDPTCVLCFDCFQMSGHKHHRYKIATSGGGGYCDCGDIEAWKTDAFCKKHKPVEDNEDISQQMNENLPNDVAYRAKLLFDVVMKYCWEVLDPQLQCLSNTALELTEANINFAEELLWEIPSSSTFCTIVYNDEKHSFEQVIQTLMEATKCSRKDAADFATRIDKEGRIIVKCSILSECTSVKQTIESQTSWNGENFLQVTIIPSYVVAHQSFAMRLLAWLQELLPHSSGLRHIFCDIMMEDGNTDDFDTLDRMPIVEKIMFWDTVYWKSLRTMWHNLIATGMLKEYEKKKEFASLFARNYSRLVKDFVDDDHDHCFSVTSLSVQIFTVPTIAHYLIEEHGILSRIVRTILVEYETVLNADLKLEFEKDATRDAFERIDFAFIDLKYILGCPPSVWTEKLKQNFLSGLDDVLLLFGYMQGMQPVTREIHNHIEFEIVYDSALNLCVKLARYVITCLSEWFGTDNNILTASYQKCLRKFYEDCDVDQEKIVTRDLVGYYAECYDYNVSSDPVSLYTPVTRLLAALYLHLETLDLNFHSPELYVPHQPHQHCPQTIMEPALRAQVLIAQVRAGMWKRNGYSLLYQLEVYHNVKVRTEVLDKDIITLQIGASLIESNEFILHLLNRFGLFEWAESFYDQNPSSPQEDIVKFKTLLAEEFFGLIITLFSARYTPGVGMVSTVECIRKEIIQQLCIDSMTHSSLDKTLVKNSNNESGLDSTIDDLATFRKTTGGSWTYELKPEFYEEFDVYHYHYSRENQSQAEEKQRERKKLKGEVEIFPPPKLPRFSHSFDSVVNILKSNVLLHVMAVVIKRCIRKSHTHSDTQLRKILHIIGLGLNEEIFRKEENDFPFTEGAEKWNIFKLLDNVLLDPTLSQHHEMIKWIKLRFNLTKTKDMTSLPDINMDIAAQTVQTSNGDEARKKKAKAEAAKKRYLEKMQQAQNSFMSKNQELFVENESLTNSITPLNTDETKEATKSASVALGPNKSSVFLDEEKLTCILCQEEGRVDTKVNPFVLTAFIQRSTVQSKYREKLLEACRNKSSRFLQERDPLFLAPDLLTVPIISCCGHVMHINCWEKYFEGVVTKEKRRPYRLRHPGNFDVEKDEYLCPYCDRISNAVLPLASALIMNYSTSPTILEESQVSTPLFENAMQIFADIIHQSSVIRGGKDIPVYMHTREDHLRYLEEENDGMALHRLYILQSLNPEELLSKLSDDTDTFKSLFPTVSYSNEDCDQYSPKFLQFINKFTKKVFKVGLDAEQIEEDYCQPLMTWQAVASTISSMEIFHRDQNLLFFGNEVPQRKTLGLRYLVRECAIMTQHNKDGRNKKFIHSHFLKLLATVIQSPQHLPCVLEVDAFTLLVSLTYSISSMSWRKSLQDDFSAVVISNGTMRDYYLLRMVFLLHATQVLITGDFQDFIKTDSEVVKMETDENNGSQPNTEAEATCRKMLIISQVWQTVGKSFVSANIDYEEVWKAACEAMIPFLRCCAKFYEHLTAVPVPNSLENNEYSFDNLVAYLGLPNSFEELFTSASLEEMVSKWANHPSVIIILKDTKDYNPAQLVETSVALPKMLAVKYPRMANQLFPLPVDYSELMNSVSNFTCDICKNNFTDIRTATMCLICGSMLCSQSYFCQSTLGDSLVGSCNYHAYYCGGGNSMFLRIRDCKMFFMGVGNRGCNVAPPYMDAYGETDAGLTRGNPLTLSKEMYDSYRRIWLQNSIQEEISRDPERRPIFRNEWQFL